MPRDSRERGFFAGDIAGAGGEAVASGQISEEGLTKGDIIKEEFARAEVREKGVGVSAAEIARHLEVTTSSINRVIAKVEEQREI